ncbi:type II CAAX prenyl endopeptidase Rce1 family protein [Caproicibacter sp.]|uniref:CPBP family glutamic-type intramembrane protease n=1 Tax=Caproicibacter sp. TaxID=2814884 RepID=UPI00398960B7
MYRNHNDHLHDYNKIDGILAIVFYILDIINIYFWVVNNLGKSIRDNIANNLYPYMITVGFADFQADKLACLISVFPSNIIPFIALFVIVKFRKQKFSSLGLRKNKNLQACLTGIILGIMLAFLIYLIYYMTGNITAFYNLYKFKFSVVDLINNLVFTGLKEELSYRAFIQSRILEIIHSKYIAIPVVGLMFWISHFFNDFVHGPFEIYSFIAQAVFILAFHILSLIIYKRSDNILTSAFFHGIYDYLTSFIYS